MVEVALQERSPRKCWYERTVDDGAVRKRAVRRSAYLSYVRAVDRVEGRGSRFLDGADIEGLQERLGGVLLHVLRDHRIEASRYRPGPLE